MAGRARLVVLLVDRRALLELVDLLAADVDPAEALDLVSFSLEIRDLDELPE